uniref:Uncharacterized protein n=1 Tax=Equus asinus TaxID=9793 RepID=A0A9L0K347_EQUAS
MLPHLIKLIKWPILQFYTNFLEDEKFTIFPYNYFECSQSNHNGEEINTWHLHFKIFTVSSTNGAETTGYACKRIKLDPYLTPYRNINSKWINDLNIRAKTIKLLEENIEVNLHDLGFGNGLLDLTPKEQTTKQEKRSTRLHKN